MNVRVGMTVVICRTCGDIITSEAMDVPVVVIGDLTLEENFINPSQVSHVNMELYTKDCEVCRDTQEEEEEVPDYSHVPDDISF